MWITIVIFSIIFIAIIISDKEPKAHYIKPENYQITWWAKEQDDGEINSQAMKGNW